MSKSFSSPSVIHERGDEAYETLRTKFFNARVPPVWPAEIVTPTCVEDVVAAVRRAKESGRKIGVRSGGHSFPCASLVEDGILLDVRNCNREITYDEDTKFITFGPGVLGQECSMFSRKYGRFFPHGHSPTVALGGFCLAGGQGWFMRGWGITSDTWITQMEVVTADGSVVIASKEKNSDLFWAARGSGKGFFGVVTRFWGRTMPAKNLFHATLLFKVADVFDQILTWVFQANDRTPKYGTDAALCTFYADKYVDGPGDEIQDTTLLIGVELIAYMNTIEEAATALSAWTDIPTELRAHAVDDQPVRQTSWEELDRSQEALNPSGNGERWQCDSILSEPSVRNLRNEVRSDPPSHV